MNSLEHEAAIFGAELVICAERQRLPRSLFEDLDHLVYRTSNIREFGKIVRGQVAPKAWEIACVEKNWRFIATARLKGRLALYDLGFTEWVAIEESKREPAEGLALEYPVFYHDSLEKARKILSDRGIRSRIIANDNAAFVDATLNPPGLELRLTNTHLAEIEEEQVESGEAIVVDLSPYRQSINVIDNPDSDLI